MGMGQERERRHRFLNSFDSFPLFFFSGLCSPPSGAISPAYSYCSRAFRASGGSLSLAGW